MKMGKRTSRVLLPVLLSGWAVVVAGCTGRAQYEVDYKQELLKKAPDGTAEIVGTMTHEGVAFPGPTSRKSSGTTRGDAGDAGRISTLVRNIEEKTVTIEVRYPDKTTGTLELASGATKEHFHGGGAYGVRITVDAIRPHEVQNKR